MVLGRLGQTRWLKHCSTFSGVRFPLLHNFHNSNFFLDLGGKSFTLICRGFFYLESV